MRTIAIIIAISMIQAEQAKPQEAPARVTDASKISWTPAQAPFPEGAQEAIIAGDPTMAVDFTLRLKLPRGYIIKPYSQPEYENITVLSGSLTITVMALDEKTDYSLSPGSFVVLRPGAVHSWTVTEDSIVQLHGDGCLEIVYMDKPAAPASCRAAMRAGGKE